MIVKWRTSKYDNTRIDCVECERETDKFVWPLNGRRTAKITDWDMYHDTWEEAHEFLLIRANRAIDVAKKNIELASEHVVHLKSLKKPGGA